MAKKVQPPPKSFEEALAELEQILGDIEGGKVGFEQSLERYERGQFLIEHTDNALPSLVHRSRSGDIVRTPIQVDDTGLLFIDRWEKKDQRFTHMEKLVQMLVRDVGLIPVK